MQDDAIKRFMMLFRGNDNAYGVFNHLKQQAFTKKNKVKKSLYESHLSGDNNGLGIVPIIDENFSWFGVLDFDNHKHADMVKLIELEKKIRDDNLPLCVCRSKSGGSHVYIFGKEPIKTVLLRQYLNGVKQTLKGFGELDIEVFPKQDKVDKHTVGNWINLPYYNSDATGRYAIIKGKKATLLEFIEYAESIAVTNDDIVNLADNPHNECPPCISVFINKKVYQGHRNKGLFNLCVYAKKAFENWEYWVYKFNQKYISPPLDDKEVDSIIKSLKSNPKYSYMCKEEPCKSNCNASLCVKKKYGINNAEKSTLMLAELPKFGTLTKFKTDPVLYHLEVENQEGKMQKLKLSSNDLLNFRFFRTRIFEQLDCVIKPLKADEWLMVIDALAKTVVHEDIPDEASTGGTIRDYLLDYLKNCDYNNEGDRSVLLTGQPIIEKINNPKNYGEKINCLIFKGIYFRTFLQANKLGNVDPQKIWLALREMGVFSKKIRVKQEDENGETINPAESVWCVPLDENKRPVLIKPLSQFDMD